MANEKLLLKAEANQLGIDGYRKMSLDELKAAIANAKGTGSKGKGKTATTANGASPAKGKTATAKTSAAPAKGKTAKSTSQKTTAGKPSAAKGKASRAATPKKKATAAKPKPKPRAKPAGRKPAASTGRKPAAKPSTNRKPKRADIDRSKIDWKAETNIGNRGGKREEVMAELRKRNGNYDKVFDALVHRAKAFYPGKTKHDAERMLRWLINRVAFDFVMATNQHKPGVRAAYGTSDRPQDVYRREQRAEAAKAAKPARKPAGRKKPAAKKMSARKPTTAKGRRKPAKRR